LRNIEFNMSIGVHDFIKLAQHRVIVNVDLYVSLGKATPKDDELAEVVNYDFVHNTIAQTISQGHIQWQETLCDETIKRMLQHPLVMAVRVSTEKPDVYDDCQGVGVEIDATRQQAT